MNMVWPGRMLGVALLLPALLSLGILVSETIVPLVIALDAAVAGIALLDLLSLIGSAQYVRRVVATG